LSLTRARPRSRALFQNHATICAKASDERQDSDSGISGDNAGTAAGLADSLVHSIQKSTDVPPNRDAVPACMDTLFSLLKSEPNAWVRAVLGQFIFVFAHPYADRNGSIGRFLMNAMLASAGNPWTVIRTERRDAYMAALERASVDSDINPFAEFVPAEMAGLELSQISGRDPRTAPAPRG
jgi:Fic family protein